MAYKFEISKGKDGQFYWRFRAPNGEVMCHSEGYTAKQSAKQAVSSVMSNAPGASVEDESGDD